MRTIDAYAFDDASEGKLGKSRIAVEQELRAALAQSDSAPAPQASMQASELEDVLFRNGFVRCDIAACNCGSWHARYGLPERLAELKELLADAGHPLCNENGNLISKALQELIAERDRLASTTAPQAQAPEALPSDATAADFASWLLGSYKDAGITEKVMAEAFREYTIECLAAPPQAPAKVLTDAEINERAFQHGLVAEGYWSEDAIAFAREILATPTPAPEAATAPSDERAAFEAWARALGHNIHRSSGGGYLVYSVQIMWMAWQARAAITAAKKGAAL